MENNIAIYWKNNLQNTYKDIQQNKNILKKYGYILNKTSFFLDKDYYIVKPGFYFKDINEEKYLHGGISPDEICIPFLKICNYKIKKSI